MKIEFFERQLVDEYGKVSVKFQQIVFAMIIVNILQQIFYIATFAIGGGLDWFFFVSWLYFVLLWVGVRGAMRRLDGYLKIYAIITIILAILRAIGILVTIIGVAGIAAICNTDDGSVCGDLSTYYGLIAIMVIFNFCYLILQCASVHYARRLLAMLVILDQQKVQSNPQQTNVVVVQTVTTAPPPYGNYPPQQYPPQNYPPQQYPPQQYPPQYAQNYPPQYQQGPPSTDYTAPPNHQ